MIARISPGRAEGSVLAPPSKSMAHRLLIAAALSDGESAVENLGFSEDILATIDCIRLLGKTVRLEGNRAVLSGCGIASENNGFHDGSMQQPPVAETEMEAEADTDVAAEAEAEALILPVRESGSTLRFLIPTALFSGRKVRFSGSEKLFSRPLSVYETIAGEQDILFEKTAGSLLAAGKLNPGVYRIPGNVSSQFVSGLLFALPFLPADSRLELIPPVESRPYISLTAAALKTFGIETFTEGDIIRIPGRQRGNACEATVEGDCSNAAFLEVLNTFGGDVGIEGLNAETLQGDRVYGECLARLSKGFSEIDLSDCPDLGPILFAAAAALNGGRFTGTRRLRIKESDRTAAMQAELAKFGIRCENEENSFTVFPGKPKKPEEMLCGHNDHRIVMALASLLTLTGGEIEGAEAVRKSWPEYFETIRKLGIEVELYAVDQ